MLTPRPSYLLHEYSSDVKNCKSLKLFFLCFYSQETILGSLCGGLFYQGTTFGKMSLKSTQKSLADITVKTKYFSTFF